MVAATMDTRSCLAGVAKNQSGVLSKFQTKSATSLQSETEAILLAINIARIKSWDSIQIVIDALPVINAINNPFQASID